MTTIAALLMIKYREAKTGGYNPSRAIKAIEKQAYKVESYSPESDRYCYRDGSFIIHCKFFNDYKI